MRIHRALHELQDRLGYLPMAELSVLAEALGEPLHRLHELASFFPHYRLEPPPLVDARVCRDLACALHGGPECRRALESLAVEVGASQLAVRDTSCLGRCDQAPAFVLNDHVYWGRPPHEARSLAEAALRSSGELPSESWPDPSHAGWNLDPYTGVADYQATQKYLGDLDPYRLLDELKAAGLRGMGGAGQPAHIKWRDTLEARGDEKFVVCNADESEPATFKDREILHRAPHVLVEGMLIAGLVLGARRGIVYIRHEYHAAIQIMRESIERAYGAGLLGQDVLGSGRVFDLEVFVSPGGYICGEQGALIETLEDRRAEPRNRPPELQTNGLNDKPTLLSNVETFAWVPAIVLRGGVWYAGLGREGFQGARLFSICGDLERPGVYQMPIGARLGELIDRAGGLSGGRALKAVATSGPSGGFVPAFLRRQDLPAAVAEAVDEDAAGLDLRDLRLDIDEFRRMGLMLGAGLVVYAEGANMQEQALSATRFFRDESCGKCVPCRTGSRRLAELAQRIASGHLAESELAAAQPLVEELFATLEQTSICGLGMSAGKPLATLLRYFWRDLGLSRPPHARANEEAAS